MSRGAQWPGLWHTAHFSLSIPSLAPTPCPSAIVKILGYAEVWLGSVILGTPNGDPIVDPALGQLQMGSGVDICVLRRLHLTSTAPAPGVSAQGAFHDHTDCAAWLSVVLSVMRLEP